VHQCFCEAVHQLGVDKAKPQAIAALMQGELRFSGPGMPTRQNIKSHLQKYRLLLAKQREQAERRRHGDIYGARTQHGGAICGARGLYGQGHRGAQRAGDEERALRAAGGVPTPTQMDVFGAMDDDTFGQALGAELSDIGSSSAHFDFSHLSPGGLLGGGTLQSTMLGTPLSGLGAMQPGRGVGQLPSHHFGGLGAGSALAGGLPGRGHGCSSHVAPSGLGGLDGPRSTFQLGGAGFKRGRQPSPPDEGLPVNADGVPILTAEEASEIPALLAGGFTLGGGDSVSGDSGGRGGHGSSAGGSDGEGAEGEGNASSAGFDAQLQAAHDWFS